MKVLIYGLNYAPEMIGIGKYNGEMGAWLASQGAQVRVVCAPPYYPDWQVWPGFSGWHWLRERIDGVEVRRCPVYIPRKPGGLKRLVHLASFALSSLPVILAQVFWKPDVVFSLEPPLFCAPAALLAAQLCGAKTWLHIQDFEVDAALAMKLLPGFAVAIGRTLERWLMAGFDRISSISDDMLTRLKSKRVHSDHIFYFPNWVDTDAIYPLEGANPYRQALGIHDDETLLLYSGNLGLKQGLDLMLECARLLRNEQKIHFVICGSGAVRDGLIAQSADLPNVHWLPLQPAEKLNILLNAADIHLLPQRMGTADLVMPSKLGPMLASGKPVITNATASSQTARLVAQAGLVADPDSAAFFVDCIQKLDGNRNLRLEFGRAGRKICETQFAKEKVLGEFMAALTDLIGHKGKE